MAIDNTPPRLRLIVTIAIIAVITLVGLDFVFKSYYAFITDMAQREKLAPLRDRDEQVTAEKASFGGAKIPIDQAMAQIAKGTRADAITPKPSDDMGPMTGWSKLPKAAPLPAPGGPAGHEATAHEGHDMPVADGGAAMADGGAAVTTDGGAATAVAGDAGAPKPAPAVVKDAGAKH